MTLKELSKILGVSPSTISRVLNDKTYSASEANKRRILEAVSTYGYTPDIGAKNLRKQTPKTQPKFTVSCIFARSTQRENNVFFEALAQQVKIGILNAGMKLGSSIYADEISAYREEFGELTKGHGVIVLGLFRNEQPELMKMYKKNVVCITLNQWKMDYDQVVCDGGAAAYTALDYLHSLGHSRIAYVGECYKEIRYTKYIEFIGNRALHSDASLTYNCRLTEEDGYNTGMKIASTVTKKATAILCGNDITAIGLLRAFKERGVRVPEDISVIAIDDIPLSQDATPPLTTVHMPMHHMCRFAVDLLKSRMMRRHTLPVQINIPGTLTVRESTRKLN